MHARLLSALCAVAVGCSSPPSPEPVRKPQPAAKPVEPATTNEDVKPAEDPKEALMTAALARALTIQGEVARIRELAFKKTVPAERQSREDFAAVVDRELAKELPKAESTRLSAALFHVGFLEDKVDLAESMALAVTSQAAAYYDPESGKFYAVSLSSDKQWLEIMTAHELMHGLQDQHFDLRAYYGEKPEVELSEDAINARRFVVEGEATFVMFLHAAAMATKTWDVDKLAMQTGMMLKLAASQMTWQKLVEQSRQTAKQIDSVDEAQLEALGKIPPFVLVPMLESYIGGAMTIAAVFDKGGWKAVADLYANPPSSTEQVLHPDKLVGTRDEPQSVTLPDLSKQHGKPLIDETLGELGWRVYLETWKVKNAIPAAAGWDGDRLAVYKTAKGMMALAALTFDSAKDAKEFEAAFADSVARRHDKSPQTRAPFARDDGGAIHIKRRRATVYIVDTADAASAKAALARLARRTKIK